MAQTAGRCARRATMRAATREFSDPNRRATSPCLALIRPGRTKALLTEINPEAISVTIEVAVGSNPVVS